MRIFIALITVFLSLSACASENDAPFKEGVHYYKLGSPVKTVDPNKIEVTEVFWYGCGHCFHFEPMVHNWSGQLPDDVVFRQSPAMWRPVMETHARAFYVVKVLKLDHDIHQAIFNALNLENKRLASKGELADFFADHGVDREKFLKAFDSFGVASQVKQADARARSYKVSGTPELVVNGTYRISAKGAGSQENMLKVADYLISEIRAGKL